MDVKDTSVKAGDNRGMHEEILNVFGQSPSHLGSRLFTQVSKALIAEREERGRTPVLVWTRPTSSPTSSWR